jgi:hypothetical protein
MKKNIKNQKSKNEKMKTENDKILSILLVTQHQRIPLLELFLENFLNQTKLNLVKELVIVNGSQNEFEHDELELFINLQIKPIIEEKEIIVKYLPTKNLNCWKKIGKYRNLANQVAEGDFFLWMDDDDYYHPTYFEEAFSGWKISGKQLVGCSANYIYDNYYKCFFKSLGFGPNHTINCVLGYTKEYGKTHLYQDDKERGEEKTFLEGYKNPTYQMNPDKTIMQFSHGKNTFNKNKLFDTNMLGERLKKDVKIVYYSGKLEDKIDKEIAKKYLKIFEEEKPLKIYKNDITIYLGSQEEFNLVSLEWIFQIIKKDFLDREIEIFGIFKNEEEINLYLKNNNLEKVNLYHFDELNNQTKIKNLWLHNVLSIFPYFYKLKLDYEKLIFSITKVDGFLIEELIKLKDKISLFYLINSRIREILSSKNILLNNKVIEKEIKYKKLDYLWKNPDRIVLIREFDEFLLYFIQIVFKEIKERNPKVELVILFKNEHLDNNFAQKIIPLLALPNIITKQYHDLDDIIEELKHASLFVDLPGNPDDYDNLLIESSLNYQTLPIVPYQGIYMYYKLPSFLYDLSKPKNLFALGELLGNLLKDKDYQKILLTKIKS